MKSRQSTTQIWRQRLFSSPLNTTVTIAVVAIMLWFLPGLLRWAVFDATFQGTTREACTASGRDGACWVFVKMRFGQFMYGLYPIEERWRPDVVFAFFVLIVAALFLPLRRKTKYGLALFGIFVGPVFGYVLLYGNVLGLTEVDTRLWGGLMLTLIISGFGIIGSLPLGILLALGRRSRLPLLRAVSVAFIELWRGVPLITVLFMASVMLPLFLPAGLNIDKLLRALIGTTLFASAYMAEVIRGGLQGVSAGQSEAAKALGLNYFQTMRLIVLPQALRLVIPGIVNTFIGLVKDTSLVLIIGMFDLLGMVQAAATDPNWLGHAIEGYVFAAACFWCICYGLSAYSQRLEKSLHRGAQA